MTDDVVVAGGGLAGLVAARRLADAGLDVTLYEREADVGGRVRSRTVDGYTLDRGFQVLFPAYPAARRELDLDALDLRAFKPGAKLCRPGERSVLSDPFRDPGALVESAFNREISLRDKVLTVTLRRELSGTSADEIFRGTDQSIRAYLREYGFSERFVEHFAAPFYGGITLDRSLSSSARVFRYTFKLLTEGPAAVPAAGMGAITGQLRERAETAGAEVETGREVTAVDHDAPGVTVDGETVGADAVVVATDPPTARELTGVSAIPSDAEACATVWCSLPRETAVTGSGNDPLRSDRRILLNVADADPNTVVSHTSVAPEYAPEGRALLSATFLGDRDETDAELFETVRRTLDAWFPERGFSGLERVGVDRIPFAQFAQPPGVHDDLPAVDAPEGDVYLAGEYTEWSAIQGALESGFQAARAVRGER
jgi:phytoene dehydrogenase-like protein